MEDALIVIGGCLVIVLVALGIALLGGLVFMVIWNFIAPIFGLPILQFWQAFALWLLIGIVGSAFRSSK